MGSLMSSAMPNVHKALVKCILADHRTPSLYVLKVDQLCEHFLAVLRLLPELKWYRLSDRCLTSASISSDNFLEWC